MYLFRCWWIPILWIVVSMDNSERWQQMEFRNICGMAYCPLLMLVNAIVYRGNILFFLTDVRDHQFWLLPFFLLSRFSSTLPCHNASHIKPLGCGFFPMPRLCSGTGRGNTKQERTVLYSPFMECWTSTTTEVAEEYPITAAVAEEGTELWERHESTFANPGCPLLNPSRLWAIPLSILMLPFISNSITGVIRELRHNCEGHTAWELYTDSLEGQLRDQERS